MTIVSIFISAGRIFLLGDASHVAADNKPSLIVIEDDLDIVFSFTKIYQTRPRDLNDLGRKRVLDCFI